MLQRLIKWWKRNTFNFAEEDEFTKRIRESFQARKTKR
jgi:hypothetical protein